ncbi:MAG TPA: aminotransferase class III-fold pyridoxal phosphate-dependent enzyme [Ilumatobacter sp.]|jgi:4-aminobutyrate aminotransferase|nr:aminotransferase class III-fold pyridoxal phosphate-dependent enzyme [Ilumatobacter sp.]
MAYDTYEELAALDAPRIQTEIPGPNARAVVAADTEVTSPSLPRAYPFAPTRGAGSVVVDVDDNIFLDFNAGIAVCSTGHSHPQVVAAIQEQTQRLIHYSASDFFLPVYSELCSRLDQIAPMSAPVKCFLTNSGTESVEAGIKLARVHTGRQYVIAFLNSFHGRSYGSVSLTASSAKYHAGFGPMLPGVVHAPYADSLSGFGNLEQPDAPGYIEKVIFKRLVPANEVAAIIVEPVLGEGGYVVPPTGWIRYLRELCDEHGILLIADEVQSGVGRTGKMWAIEHFDVEPDILLAGKGIASGMPLGAMIAPATTMTWERGAHGSTYGGNPLSCMAALETIDLVEKELLANTNEVGTQLIDGLRGIAARIDMIEEVRGLGLMIGIEFETAALADAVEIACFERGLLVLRAGDKALRMSPPLMLRAEQAATGLKIFEDACAAISTTR